MKRIPVSNRELGGENGLVMTYLIEMGLVGETLFIHGTGLVALFKPRAVFVKFLM